MFLYIFLLVIGAVLVIYGGDIFVDSSVLIAKRLKIPAIIIGATIVSIATTLPELIVSVISSVNGSYDLAVGNAIGSTICNTALICGLSMAILPTIIKEKTSPVKYALLLFSSVLLLIFGFNFNISWIESLCFLCVFILFILYNVLDALKQIKSINNFTNNVEIDAPVIEDKDITIVEDFAIQETKIKKVRKKLVEKFPNLFFNIVFFVLGAAMIAIGAYLLIEGATNIAVKLGINEAFIGLTIVAIGTSLPELITTITSIKKKNTELGYGNIIGANILNIALIIGSCGLISGSSGLPISKLTYLVSMPVSTILSIIFIVPMFFKNETHRWQGIVLLSMYAAYMIFLIVMTILGIAV